MHVSIHGSFTFILTSIYKHSMNPDKWLKILFDFNKETSMLILKILPIEMNESSFSAKLYSLQVHLPNAWSLPAILVLFFGSVFIKSGIFSNPLDLDLLQKQTEATWGPWFPLTFFPCQGSEDVRTGGRQSSPAREGPYLPMQCFPVSEHASIYFWKL